MQTCLVVDTAPVVRKIASRMLPQFGLAVDCVADAAEADKRLAQKGLPDILIVAAPILGNEAADFVRRVKALPGGAKVAILAVIVEGNLGLMTRLKRAGVADFLFKPFDKASLAAAIGPYLVQGTPSWMGGGGDTSYGEARAEPSVPER